MPVKLTDEQRAAVFCRNREMLVSAAAGSGKTRVIVERIMARVTGPEQKNIDDFLVITFTMPQPQSFETDLKEKFPPYIRASSDMASEKAAVDTSRRPDHKIDASAFLSLGSSAICI